LELITPHGNANWANTFHIVTRSRRGLQKHYFLKLVSGSLAWERVFGEYSGMVELHQTLPDLIPKPYSAGRCQNSDVCYFLSEFVPIHHQTPDAAHLGAKIAELHRLSTSPTGKFGFFTTPFDGRLPLVVDWESSWTTFFKKLLKGVYDLDVQYNGKVCDSEHLRSSFTRSMFGYLHAMLCKTWTILLTVKIVGRAPSCNGVDASPRHTSTLGTS